MKHFKKRDNGIIKADSGHMDAEVRITIDIDDAEKVELYFPPIQSLGIIVVSITTLVYRRRFRVSLMRQNHCQ